MRSRRTPPIIQGSAIRPSARANTAQMSIHPGSERGVCWYCCLRDPVFMACILLEIIEHKGLFHLWLKGIEHRLNLASGGASRKVPDGAVRYSQLTQIIL